MTTFRSVPASPWPSAPSRVARWLGPGALMVGLAGIVGARWLATTRGLDPLGTGAAFGLALLALWLLATRSRLRRPAGRRRITVVVAAGVAFGLALVGLVLAGAVIGGSPIAPGLSRPAAPFLPWAAITILVAAAQEGILRGVLFDRLRTAGGIAAAIAITTILFALIHVPLYGWHVVPLDLAVGLGLAGLRLSTGTFVAPAVAHATADLATWWL